MFILNVRPCKVGGSINARTEKHGEEPVPAMDVIIETQLNAKELNELMGEPHTADAWFDHGADKLPEPLLKHLAPYKLKGKFKDSSANVLVGLQLKQIDFPNVTLSGLVFEPQVGGMTVLKCRVQTHITHENSEIFFWMGHEADVELRFGARSASDDQRELDLSVDPEDGDDDEAAEVRKGPKRAAKPRNGAGRKSKPRPHLNA